jgi:hypothetical protein
MIRLRKMALVALVWLTSALTVAAGVPETVCGCSQHPARVAGKAEKRAKCKCDCGGACCGVESGACCSSTALANSTPSSESHFVASRQGAPTPGLSPNTSRCIRILVANQSPFREDSKSKASGDGPLKPSQLGVGSWSLAATDLNTQRSVSCLERPAYSCNLITALQHLNI